MDDAEYIYAEHLLDVADVQRIDKRGHADSGVGDHQIDRPELLTQGLYRREDLVAVADISGSDGCRTAGLTDFVRQRDKLFLPAPHQTHLVAPNPQPLPHGPT